MTKLPKDEWIRRFSVRLSMAKAFPPATIALMASLAWTGYGHLEPEDAAENFSADLERKSN